MALSSALETADADVLQRRGEIKFVNPVRVSADPAAASSGLVAFLFTDVQRSTGCSSSLEVDEI